jgi:hypothetical protein
MNSTRSDNSVILNVEGTIYRVDTSSRELTLLVNSAQMNLIVPPDCLIRLNGERVKLRLLQPGDQAEVAYSFVGSTAFAHSIQVNWLSRVAAASKGRTGAKSAAPSARCRTGSAESLP